MGAPRPPDDREVEAEADRQGALDDLDVPAAEKVARREAVRQEADDHLDADRPEGPASA